MVEMVHLDPEIKEIIEKSYIKSVFRWDTPMMKFILQAITLLLGIFMFWGQILVPQGLEVRPLHHTPLDDVIYEHGSQNVLKGIF